MNENDNTASNPPPFAADPVTEGDRRIQDPGVEHKDEHPVGTVAGVGAGAAVGAVAGTGLAGPVGTVVGGVVGGIVGGLAGHGAAAVVHPGGDAVDGDIIPDPGTGPDHRRP